MFCISVNEWHRRAVSFTAHIRACDARGVFSICRLTKWGHKYMNNIPRTARRVTSWAFDRFIWVKRSSYHIYIGYRNLKGPHGNLSKYKFGLAEYITVYVIQLQQLLQLLLRIITQYAKYVYFKFYKMFTEVSSTAPCCEREVWLSRHSVASVCVCSEQWAADKQCIVTFTFKFMHLADAFIQSDLQLHSGYTFVLVHVFPGNQTHNLSLSWRNVLPLSHTGTHC